mmetsp:Transcript_6300/g.10278  ORF Transcript_6300/g.10278 Transcript_6300/m.10278 type:complete len:214 (+) Transcript_6300:730-1371(+)
MTNSAAARPKSRRTTTSLLTRSSSLVVSVLGATLTIPSNSRPTMERSSTSKRRASPGPLILMLSTRTLAPTLPESASSTALRTSTLPSGCAAVPSPASSRPTPRSTGSSTLASTASKSKTTIPSISLMEESISSSSTPLGSEAATFTWASFTSPSAPSSSPSPLASSSSRSASTERWETLATSLGSVEEPTHQTLQTFFFSHSSLSFFQNTLP